jgi:hypothetical protein
MRNARTSLLHERLAKAVAYLERLDVERFAHGKPSLGKSIEERIIWRELLDLELQEFDEQTERLSEVAHSLVPDVGTVTHARGEIEQQPQRPIPPSPWWRLGRLFR